MKVLEISQQMDRLLNLYVKGEIGKEELEEKRQELYAAIERG